MPLYAYQATDIQGKPHQGVLAADSPRAARDGLRDRGLLVVTLTPQAQVKGSWWSADSRRTTRFYRELATLLAVGVRLADALELLGKQAETSFQPVLLNLRDRVVQGASLSQAMRQTGDGKLFDAVACRVVEVGEQGGELPDILEHLADYREKGEELNGKLLRAIAYPVVIFIFGIGVCLFLMTSVVPTLLGTLKEMGRELPPITQAVKAVSDTLVGDWWLVLLVVAVIGTAVYALMRSPTTRLWWDKQLLRMPIVKQIHQNQQVARAAFVIGALMKAGVPFEETLGVARGTLSNRHLKNGLQSCEEAVRKGKDLGTALGGADGWPQTVVQAFMLGQQSGQLPQILERITRDLNKEAERQASRLAGLLGPVLIILLAVMIGTVALAVMLPVLEAGQGG